MDSSSSKTDKNGKKRLRFRKRVEPKLLNIGAFLQYFSGVEDFEKLDRVEPRLIYLRNTSSVET